jgi:hypothetical protein
VVDSSTLALYRLLWSGSIPVQSQKIETCSLLDDEGWLKSCERWNIVPETSVEEKVNKTEYVNTLPKGRKKRLVSVNLKHRTYDSIHTSEQQKEISTFRQ